MAHEDNNSSSLFIDTNLDTHVVIIVSHSDTVSDLKRKIMLEHHQCFPAIGDIKIDSLKVKRRGCFYNLPDSMFVKSAFATAKDNWFLSVYASRLAQGVCIQQVDNYKVGDQLALPCATDNCSVDQGSPSTHLTIVPFVNQSFVNAINSKKRTLVQSESLVEDASGSGPSVEKKCKTEEIEASVKASKYLGGEISQKEKENELVKERIMGNEIPSSSMRTSDCELDDFEKDKTAEKEVLSTSLIKTLHTLLKDAVDMSEKDLGSTVQESAGDQIDNLKEDKESSRKQEPEVKLPRRKKRGKKSDARRKDESTKNKDELEKSKDESAKNKDESARQAVESAGDQIDNLKEDKESSRKQEPEVKLCRRKKRGKKSDARSKDESAKNKDEFEKSKDESAKNKDESARQAVESAVTQLLHTKIPNKEKKTSSMATPKMSLKLLVDKKCQRVLFAEAPKEFVDFIFHVFSLPLGTLIEFIGSEQMVGCLGKLKDSIESFHGTYLQPGVKKNNIFNPKTPFNGSTFLLSYNASSTDQASSSKAIYRCSNASMNCEDPKSICPNCSGSMNVAMTRIHPKDSEVVAAAMEKISKGGGYVKEVVTYMVMDNLAVEPMSTISSITLINKFGVKDLSQLEEKMVTFGKEEGLKLLETSLMTDKVLTTIFMH